MSVGLVCLALTSTALVTLRGVARPLILIALIGMSVRIGDSYGPLGLSISDLSVLGLAVWFGFGGRRYLAMSKASDWWIALALSQSLSTLLSLPLAVNTGDAIGVLLGALARAVLVVGVAGVFQERARSTADDELAPLLIAATAVVSLQALLLPANFVAPQLEAVTSEGSVVRIAGWSGGFLSGMLVVGMVWCFSVAAFGTRHRFVALLSGALAAGVVVLTYTRGAYVDTALAIFLLAALALLGRKSFIPGIVSVVLFLGLAMAMVFAFVPGVRPRFADLAQGAVGTTLETRFILWRVALGMVEQHPLVGVGAGGFNEAMRANYYSSVPPPFLEIFEYPEQQLLGLAAETGLIGLFLYLVAILALIGKVVRRLSWHSSVGARVSAVGVACGTVMLGRILSEVGGTWVSGNDWLTVVAGLAVGWCRVSDRDAQRTV